MRVTKTVGVAAALMLTGSYTAMAAKISLGEAAGSFASPSVTAQSVAEEQFGTSALGDAVYAAAQGITIWPSGSNAFTNSQMVVTFTLTGTTFKTALPSANTLVGGKNCAGTYSSAISSGGSAGSSTVTFLVDNAQACESLNLKLLDLNTPTADVTIAATLKNTSSQDIDNGIQNGPLTYAKRVNGVTAAAAAATSGVIDLATSNKKFAASVPAGGPVGTGLVKMATSKMTLTMPANSAVLAVGKFGSALTLPAGAKATITVSGLPASVTKSGAVANDVFFLTTDAVALAADVDAAKVAAGTSCSVPSGGTTTCTLSAAATAAWTSGLTGILVNDGSTVISGTTVTATAAIDYDSTNSKWVASETLFSNVAIANIGTTACAAEFGSMMGAKTTNALTTIRLSNTSGSAGKVYVTATDDKGSHSNVVQITRANGGASAAAVLNSSELLPAGATVEILGTAVEAATLNFDSWSGTTRGRVRVFVEAAGGSLGGNQGCKAEAWMCINGTCSIVNQTGDGKDGTTTAKQNN